MKAFYIGAISLFMLAGCAQNQYNSGMTPTQIMYQASIKNENETQKATNACFANARNSTANPETSSAVNLVDREVLFAGDDSPNKVSLMASNSEITDIQKNALLQYIQAHQSCRNILKNGLQSEPSLSILYVNYFEKMDVLYALLLKNQIKIGEANLEKSKLLSNLRQEYSTASQNLANRYIQQINQEIQAAQADWAQRRAIASQYLMNQQQINSRQYQAPMPYQMPTLRAPAPIQPPTNTNCRMIGNTLNCTTY